VQLQEVPCPNTTASYRQYMVEAIAQDIKDAICRYGVLLLSLLAMLCRAMGTTSLASRCCSLLCSLCAMVCAQGTSVWLWHASSRGSCAAGLCLLGRQARAAVLISWRNGIVQLVHTFEAAECWARPRALLLEVSKGTGRKPQCAVPLECSPPECCPAGCLASSLHSCHAQGVCHWMTCMQGV
jgi:hypothetical protein